eukprot:gnl/Chilomastix_cuspidata/4068.p1 GENE.gnl/Chilomastix_cuspidata/4068~~gnl/Chilomastix_cuspidata/4068.p1  ORF type:complete len:1295 (+),score=347.76 gnl/Chilomastix_cuspidata/4068:253-4137(+)
MSIGGLFSLFLIIVFTTISAFFNIIVSRSYRFNAHRYALFHKFFSCSVTLYLLFTFCHEHWVLLNTPCGKSMRCLAREGLEKSALVCLSAMGASTALMLHVAANSSRCSLFRKTLRAIHFVFLGTRTVTFLGFQVALVATSAALPGGLAAALGLLLLTLAEIEFVGAFCARDNGAPRMRAMATPCEEVSEPSSDSGAQTPVDSSFNELSETITSSLLVRTPTRTPGRALDAPHCAALEEKVPFPSTSGEDSQTFASISLSSVSYGDAQRLDLASFLQFQAFAASVLLLLAAAALCRSCARAAPVLAALALAAQGLAPWNGVLPFQHEARPKRELFAELFPNAPPSAVTAFFDASATLVQRVRNLFSSLEELGTSSVIVSGNYILADVAYWFGARPPRSVAAARRRVERSFDELFDKGSAGFPSQFASMTDLLDTDVLFPMAQEVPQRTLAARKRAALKELEMFYILCETYFFSLADGAVAPLAVLPHSLTVTLPLACAVRYMGAFLRQPQRTTLPSESGSSSISLPEPSSMSWTAPFGGSPLVATSQQFDTESEFELSTTNFSQGFSAQSLMSSVEAAIETLNTANEGANWFISLCMILLQYPLVPPRDREQLRDTLGALVLRRQLALQQNTAQQRIVRDDSFPLAEQDLLARDAQLLPMQFGPAPGPKGGGAAEFLQKVHRYLDSFYPSGIIIPDPFRKKPRAQRRRISIHGGSDTLASSTASDLRGAAASRSWACSLWGTGVAGTGYDYSDTFVFELDGSLFQKSCTEEHADRPNFRYGWELCANCLRAVRDAVPQSVDPTVPSGLDVMVMPWLEPNLMRACTGQDRECTSCVVSPTFSLSTPKRVISPPSPPLSPPAAHTPSLTDADRACAKPIPAPAPLARFNTLSFEPVAVCPFEGIISNVFIDSGLVSALGLDTTRLARFLQYVNVSFRCRAPQQWNMRFFQKLNALSAARALGAGAPMPLISPPLGENAYFNILCGVRRLHFMYIILAALLADLPGLLSPLEILALLVIVLCLDVFHPGLDDQMLIEAMHPLATLYNDRKVQRMHAAHCSWQFVVWSELLLGLPSERVAEFRAHFMKLSLAVDDPMGAICTLRAQGRLSGIASRAPELLEAHDGADALGSMPLCHPLRGTACFGTARSAEAARGAAWTCSEDQKNLLMKSLVVLAYYSDLFRPRARHLLDGMLTQCAHTAPLLRCVLDASPGIEFRARLGARTPERAEFLAAFASQLVFPAYRDFKAVVLLVCPCAAAVCARVPANTHRLLKELEARIVPIREKLIDFQPTTEGATA